MKISIIKSLVAAALVFSAISVSGCAYGAIEATADGKAVVTRNDGFLFGLLRAVYVCQITPAGLAQCASSENP